MRFALFGCLLALSACKRGSARGARLVGERVAPAVAAIANVDRAQVKFKVEDEPSSELWFVTADTPGAKWRCFFDRDAEWCDPVASPASGSIFAKLVAHRRLGDNRASIDDPTWILLLRESHGWLNVYPDKDFMVPSDDVRAKLRIPRVERPKDGGVEIDVCAIDTPGTIASFHVSIQGEGDVKVTRTQLYP